MSDIINSYTLIEEIELEALNGVGKLYTHNKSGAKLVIIKNDDDNKTFSIAFKTPPTDSTGLPHILEHSVLCGSKKFPVKDPFVELAKGSLNTFLNAMTFSDKTMYPIASCNDKDFQNLMDVYLDAVFYPNIYKEPKIFYQEGWHHSLKDGKEDITYNGVVYNEMKGAYSSPERLLMRNIQASLYPDNAYGYESGGYPDDITNLSYEDFIQYHKTYYHPSNSYIFLYGDIDIDHQLEWIDSQYLKAFDAITIDTDIQLQESFDEVKEVTESYPLSSNESTEKKTYLSMNYVLNKAGDPLAYYGNEILEYVLFEAPGAPIKEALLKANMGEDVFSILDNNVLQPSLSIAIKGTEDSNKEQFIQIINDEMKRLMEEGIDQEKLQAAINRFEFKTREADFGRFPKGVMYAIVSLDSWLYGLSPFVYYNYNDIFQKLNEGVENGYFNELIKQYFIDNKHKSFLILKPDTEMAAQKEAVLGNKLKEYKETLTNEEIEKLVNDTKGLLAFQNMPETKEGLESIPLLEIKDIDKKSRQIDYSIEKNKSVKILKNVTFTNHIVYNKLLFNIKGLEKELIPYAGLLKNVLGKMSTKNYHYSKLSDQVNLYTGGLSHNIAVYGVNNDADAFSTCLTITGKVFNDKVDKLYELINEIVVNTVYDNTARIKDILFETKSRVQSRLVSNGHVTALTRAESYYSKSAYYNDLVSGIGFYEFLNDLCSRFEEVKEEIVTNLKKVSSLVFNQSNVFFGFTGDHEVYDQVKTEMENFVEQLPEGEALTSEKTIEMCQLNEGYMTSAKVQYVANVGNYLKAGYDYTGALKVLKTILSLDYLWQSIRIKGGAYGAMINLKRSGGLSFVSYRDPNLTKTLACYKGISEYIENLAVDDREITKYIIGTISEVDQPLTKSMENDQMIALYLNELSKEDIQTERDEILGTTLETLKQLSSLVEEVINQNNLCVVGNESTIKSNEKLFSEIKYLV